MFRQRSPGGTTRGGTARTARRLALSLREVRLPDHLVKLSVVPAQNVTGLREIIAHHQRPNPECIDNVRSQTMVLRGHGDTTLTGASDTITAGSMLMARADEARSGLQWISTD